MIGAAQSEVRKLKSKVLIEKYVCLTLNYEYLGLKKTDFLLFVGFNMQD